MSLDIHVPGRAATILWAVLSLILIPSARSAELKPVTVEAFDQYMAAVEESYQEIVSGDPPRLFVDSSPGGRQQLNTGRIVITKLKEEIDVPGGLVTDWAGSMFIPEVSLDAVLKAMRDYEQHSEIYESVARSKLLKHEGSKYVFQFRFDKSAAGIRVVVDAEFEAEFKQLSERRWSVCVRSNRIVEVENPDTPKEKELPVGNDGGFLWRMESFWLLEETEGGVYAELSTTSLSRAIPTGLGWLVRPFVQRIPRRTLEDTMQSIRMAAKEWHAK